MESTQPTRRDILLAGAAMMLAGAAVIPTASTAANEKSRKLNPA